MASSSSSSSSSSPLVIAIDLDEVLGYFVQTLVRFHNESYGSEYTVDHFVSYDFIDVWGGTIEETNAKVIAFFESSHFKEELPPIPDAYDVLNELKSKGVDFHLVTSRQDRIQPETEEWISRHYPGIFTALHYGNHYSEDGIQRTKSEMCEAIGAKLLVDDSVIYALQVATAAGIEVLLFGDYPWNQFQQPLPALVTRVNSWDEVKQRIERMLDEHQQKSSTEGNGRNIEIS